jgi:hypothetical protein
VMNIEIKLLEKFLKNTMSTKFGNYFHGRTNYLYFNSKLRIEFKPHGNLCLICFMARRILRANLNDGGVTSYKF